MSKSTLFRNLGDEETIDRPIIKINQPSNTSINACAAIIIPGIQGVAAREWYAFGAKLKTPTNLIQLINSIGATTIDEISEATFATVRDCFANQKEFYIIGHSFGAIVAIQLAQMFERNGVDGRVLLIDGSPVHLKRLSEAMIKSMSKKENSDDVVIMMIFFNMCSAERTYKFILQLQKCTEWTKKMDLLYGHLPEAIKSHYSYDHLYNMVLAMTNRLKAVIKLNFDDEVVKLKSPITLIRPTQASFTDIAEDYDLSKYAEQPVDVRYVKGNHLTMLDGNEITQIIDNFAPIE